MRNRHRANFRGWFCLILLSFLLAACAPSRLEWQERESFLMDTVIRIRVLDEFSSTVLDDIFTRLQEINDRFNRHSEDSDIAQVNRMAGVSSVKVSDETYRLLSRAIDYYHLTNGAFNPAIGALSDLWRISGAGEERMEIPSDSEVKEALKYCDPSFIELKDGAVFLSSPRVVLDLGAMVKGYATDEVVEILERHQVMAAILDLGGNVYVYGEKPGSDTWRIGIANPFTEEHHEAFILQGRDISCVTSGDYERYFVYQGEKYHHIFEGKTGYPVRGELASVSIFSRKSEQADVLSTACFVLGEKASLELLKNWDAEAVFITKSKEIHANEAMFEKIEQESLEEGFSLKRVE